MKRKPILFACTVVLLSVPPVFAQTQPGAEIGAYVGAAAADGGIVRVVDSRRMREVRTRVEDKGVSLGFVVGASFNRWIGTEMLFSFATNHYVADVVERGSSTTALDNNLFVFLVGNGVVYLAQGRIVPFVSAGAGISGTVDNKDLAYNFGGGVKLFVADHLGIRLDIRQFVQNVTDPLQDPFTERVRLMTFNVGFTFVR